MEPQDIQQQESVEIFTERRLLEPQAPATLLPAVLERLAQLNVYCATSTSEEDLQNALYDPRWEVRMAAVHALGKLSERAPLEPLMTALQDEHRQVRAAAVRAIGRLGEHAPLEQLILALQDRDWEVREMTVLVLGELGVQTSHLIRPLLVTALQDAYGPVREAARAALEQYDAPAHAALPLNTSITTHTGMRRTMSHYWLVFSRQLSLLQKRWIIPAGIMFLSYALIIVTSMFLDKNAQHTGTAYMLALAAMLSSVVGTAFTTDARQDVGLEITLSTPTSLRIILFCRFLVVIVSNVLLAMCTSGVIALLYGQGLLGIIDLWLGPLLFVSSLTLALVLLLGNWLSFTLMCVLGFVQTLFLGPRSATFMLPLQTSPAILGMALLCLLFAFLYAPWQGSLLREHF